MRPSELKEMKAGKELDKLVAEKVFGWKVETRPNMEGSPYTAEFWVADDGGVKYPYNFYNPSSDIQQALEVIEYMGNIDISLSRMEKGYEHLQYTVVAYGNDYTRTDKIYGEKLPEAICKAAVFAKMFLK